MRTYSLILFAIIFISGCARIELTPSQAFEKIKENGCYWIRNGTSYLGENITTESQQVVWSIIGDDAHLIKLDDGSWSVYSTLSMECYGVCSLSPDGQHYSDECK